jgi:hypothetical protein
MKTVLNIIADILTLIAVCTAGVGHVLPWFEVIENAPMIGNTRFGPGLRVELGNFQAEIATRSAVALGVLAALLCLSLLIHWGPAMRRLLNLGMFASAFLALLFEILALTGYFNWGGARPAQMHAPLVGFRMALIATGVAVGLSLVRMIWTMPPTRRINLAESDKKLPLALPVKETVPGEQKLDIVRDERYPVRVEADYPGRSSRWLALVGVLFMWPKALLLLPHLLLLAFINMAAIVAVFISFLAVLFTGHYPRGTYDFVLGALRWQTRVSAWMLGLVDVYPPFSLR